MDKLWAFSPADDIVQVYPMNGIFKDDIPPPIFIVDWL